MSLLAVLAGGEGRRMGKPKDQLVVDGKPILVALLERLRWDGPSLLVAPCGGRVPPGYEAFDEVVHDSEPGQGPLRGILTALWAGAGEEEIIVVPVDMPGVEREHIDWLERELRGRPPVAGLLVVRDEQIEPFPSGWRVGAGRLIHARLARGERAVQGMAEEQEIEIVQPPATWGELVWRNVNVPAELPPGWKLG